MYRRDVMLSYSIDSEHPGTLKCPLRPLSISYGSRLTGSDRVALGVVGSLCLEVRGVHRPKYIETVAMVCSHNNKSLLIEVVLLEPGEGGADGLEKRGRGPVSLAFDLR